MPAASDGPQEKRAVSTIRPHCGGNDWREGVEMRVLVATASRHGATNEIAIEIGRTLNDHGVDTEVLDVEDVSAL